MSLLTLESTMTGAETIASTRTDAVDLTAGAPVTPDVQLLLRSIWERNQERVLGRVERVRAAVEATDPRRPVLALTHELQADLHALMGALGTFGWPEGSALVEGIYSCCVAAQALERRDLMLARLSELDRDLRATPSS
jgi:hypothetical protein